MLAGLVPDHGGAIAIDGRPVALAGPRDAERAGVRLAPGEHQLVPEMTVAANLFLGHERRRFGLIDDRAMVRETAWLFSQIGMAIKPRARVGDLRAGERRLVAVARASGPRRRS